MEPAVDRAFTPERRREAAAAFGIDPEALSQLGDFENYVFRYPSDGGSRILRVTHPTHRDREQIEAEIAWVNFLRSHGLRVAGALPSPSGSLVERIGEGFGTFLVASFEFAPGALPAASDWGPALFERWGAFLGRSHRLTVDYLPPVGAVRRERWDATPYIRDGLDLIPDDQPAMRRLFAATRAELAALPTDARSFGLCHTDLHQGNFHVHRGEIHAFDTDDCAYHWFFEDISSAVYYGVYDIAETLDDAIYPSKVAFVEAFLPHFWRGYRSEYDLDDAWLERLPLFLRWRALTIYAMLHRKWDPENLGPEQQASLARFRKALEAGAPWSQQDWQERLEQGLPFDQIDYRAAATGG
jgi:Ser/Thr protein kinase RdoA (MazF antagonist)